MKERLPKDFSYPLGAELISKNIGELPQAEKVSLIFAWKDEFWASKWRKRVAQRGTVALIQARYYRTRDEWWISVYAVPSDCSAVAREFLLGGALARIGEALRKGASLPESFPGEKVLWLLPPLKSQGHDASG